MSPEKKQINYRPAQSPKETCYYCWYSSNEGTHCTKLTSLGCAEKVQPCGYCDHWTMIGKTPAELAQERDEQAIKDFKI